MGTRTMADLSYGISTPADLFAKLRRDGARLTAKPAPDDVFNFLVTAAALNEWIRKVYRNDQLVNAISNALNSREWKEMPEETAAWITDIDCLPNKHCDVRRHIFNALSICWQTAGASKHYHWQGGVETVSPEPIVDGWYQYFTTSREPDLYVEYTGEVYGLSQIRRIVVQFYTGMFKHVERGADA
jgi:hypothetical protein